MERIKDMIVPLILFIMAAAIILTIGFAIHNSGSSLTMVEYNRPVYLRDGYVNIKVIEKRICGSSDIWITNKTSDTVIVIIATIYYDGSEGPEKSLKLAPNECKYWGKTSRHNFRAKVRNLETDEWQVMKIGR